MIQNKALSHLQMSSRRGGVSKGKTIAESHAQIEQLTQGVADTNLDPGQDDGQWEVYGKKSKNRAGSSAAKPWGSQAHNSNPRAWGNTNMAQKPGMQNLGGGAGRASGNPWQTQNANLRRPAGRGNGGPQVPSTGYQNYNVTSNPLIRPPLEHGWNWQSRTGSMQSNVRNEFPPEDLERNNDVDDDDEEEGEDLLEDSDDDLLSDGDDSDASQKSHETRKKCRWFREFFEILDGLTIEQINDPERQWHCAACQGGPGAIDWFRGLQPLMAHAKTKGSKRVKIHRELAVLLDEELRRRGTSVIPAGEAFGKWKGLKNEEKDHEIVWPPMVVIQNTKLEQDENDKVWLCFLFASDNHFTMKLLDLESNSRVCSLVPGCILPGHLNFSNPIGETSCLVGAWGKEGKRGLIEGHNGNEQFIHSFIGDRRLFSSSKAFPSNKIPNFLNVSFLLFPSI